MRCVFNVRDLRNCQIRFCGRRIGAEIYPGKKKIANADEILIILECSSGLFAEIANKYGFRRLNFSLWALFFGRMPKSGMPDPFEIKSYAY